MDMQDMGIIVQVREPSATAKNKDVVYFKFITFDGGNWELSAPIAYAPTLQQATDRKLPVNFLANVSMASFEGRSFMRCNQLQLTDPFAKAATNGKKE